MKSKRERERKREEDNKKDEERKTVRYIMEVLAQW